MSRRYPAVDGELEDELTQELQDELEYELGGLVRELDDELEDDNLTEYQGEDDELEDHFGGLAGELEDELSGDRFTDHEDDEFETVVRELEDEFGFDERFVNPARRVYSDAELMAELAFAAESAETEEEVEAFLGALAPLAIKAASVAAPLIAQYGPKLIQGAVSLGKRLWGSPTTRNLVRQVPKILGRTAVDVGTRFASGGAVNPRYIARTLVGNAVGAVQPTGPAPTPSAAQAAGPQPVRRRRGPRHGQARRSTARTAVARQAAAQRAARQGRGKARARRR
jgi:hypothetical protein